MEATSELSTQPDEIVDTDVGGEMCHTAPTMQQNYQPCVAPQIPNMNYFISEPHQSYHHGSAQQPPAPHYPSGPLHQIYPHQMIYHAQPNEIVDLAGCGEVYPMSAPVATTMQQTYHHPFRTQIPNMTYISGMQHPYYHHTLAQQPTVQPYHSAPPQQMYDHRMLSDAQPSGIVGMGLLEYPMSVSVGTAMQQHTYHTAVAPRTPNVTYVSGMPHQSYHHGLAHQLPAPHYQSGPPHQIYPHQMLHGAQPNEIVDSGVGGDMYPVSVPVLTTMPQACHPSVAPHIPNATYFSSVQHPTHHHVSAQQAFQSGQPQQMCRHQMLCDAQPTETASRGCEEVYPMSVPVPVATTMQQTYHHPVGPHIQNMTYLGSNQNPCYHHGSAQQPPQGPAQQICPHHMLYSDQPDGVVDLGGGGEMYPMATMMQQCYHPSVTPETPNMTYSSSNYYHGSAQQPPFLPYPSGHTQDMCPHHMLSNAQPDEMMELGGGGEVYPMSEPVAATMPQSYQPPGSPQITDVSHIGSNPSPSYDYGSAQESTGPPHQSALPQELYPRMRSCNQHRKRGRNSRRQHAGRDGGSGNPQDPYPPPTDQDGDSYLVHSAPVPHFPAMQHAVGHLQSYDEAPTMHRFHPQLICHNCGALVSSPLNQGQPTEDMEQMDNVGNYFPFPGPPYDLDVNPPEHTPQVIEEPPAVVLPLAGANDDDNQQSKHQQTEKVKHLEPPQSPEEIKRGSPAPTSSVHVLGPTLISSQEEQPSLKSYPGKEAFPTAGFPSVPPVKHKKVGREYKPPQQQQRQRQQSQRQQPPLLAPVPSTQQGNTHGRLSGSVPRNSPALTSPVPLLSLTVVNSQLEKRPPFKPYPPKDAITTTILPPFKPVKHEVAGRENQAPQQQQLPAPGRVPLKNPLPAAQPKNELRRLSGSLPSQALQPQTLTSPVPALSGTVVSRQSENNPPLKSHPPKDAFTTTGFPSLPPVKRKVVARENQAPQQQHHQQEQPPSPTSKIPLPARQPRETGGRSSGTRALTSPVPSPSPASSQSEELPPPKSIPLEDAFAMNFPPLPSVKGKVRGQENEAAQQQYQWRQSPSPALHPSTVPLPETQSSSKRKSWAGLFKTGSASPSELGEQRPARPPQAAVTVSVPPAGPVVKPHQDAPTDPDIDPATGCLRAKLIHRSDHETVVTDPSGYCYTNPNLQALNACPPSFSLISAFADAKSAVQTLNLHKESKTPIIDSMLQFMRELQQSPPSWFQQTLTDATGDSSPDTLTGPPFESRLIHEMLQKIRSESSFYGESRPGDAEEFLSLLLNGLDDEVLQLQELVAEVNSTLIVTADGDSHDDCKKPHWTMEYNLKETRKKLRQLLDTMKPKQPPPVNNVVDRERDESSGPAPTAPVHAAVQPPPENTVVGNERDESSGPAPTAPVHAAVQPPPENTVVDNEREESSDPAPTDPVHAAVQPPPENTVVDNERDESSGPEPTAPVHASVEAPSPRNPKDKLHDTPKLKESPSLKKEGDAAYYKNEKKAAKKARQFEKKKMRLLQEQEQREEKEKRIRLAEEERLRDEKENLRIAQKKRSDEKHDTIQLQESLADLLQLMEEDHSYCRHKFSPAEKARQLKKQVLRLQERRKEERIRQAEEERLSKDRETEKDCTHPRINVVNKKKNSGKRHDSSKSIESPSLEDLVGFIEGSGAVCKNDRKAAKKARQLEKKLMKREEEERVRQAEDSYLERLHEKCEKAEVLENVCRAKETNNESSRSLEDLEFIKGSDAVCKTEKKAAKKARQLEKKKQKEEEDRIREAEEERLREEQEAEVRENTSRAYTAKKKRNTKVNQQPVQQQRNSPDTLRQEPENSESSPPRASEPGTRMVTIKRVTGPCSSEPSVTITLKGDSPEQDELLYSPSDGKACKFLNKMPNPKNAKDTKFLKVENTGKVAARVEMKPSIPLPAPALPRPAPPLPPLSSSGLTNPTAIQLGDAESSGASRGFHGIMFKGIRLPPGVTCAKVDPVDTKITMASKRNEPLADEPTAAESPSSFPRLDMDVIESEGDVTSEICEMMSALVINPYADDKEKKTVTKLPARNIGLAVEVGEIGALHPSGQMPVLTIYPYGKKEGAPEQPAKSKKKSNKKKKK